MLIVYGRGSHYNYRHIKHNTSIFVIYEHNMPQCTMMQKKNMHGLINNMVHKELAGFSYKMMVIIFQIIDQSNEQYIKVVAMKPSSCNPNISSASLKYNKAALAGLSHTCCLIKTFYNRGLLGVCSLGNHIISLFIVFLQRFVQFLLSTYHHNNVITIIIIV